VDVQELVKEFMAQKRFALVGATGNTQKNGYRIFKNLSRRGYEVYPVNPGLEDLEGVRCYHRLADIPVKVDVVDFVVPPPVTEATLKECKKLGLERIWLQPGSESEAALAFCRENGLRVVHGICVMSN
jgi:predicted CoA-binding protein